MTPTDPHWPLTMTYIWQELEQQEQKTVDYSRKLRELEQEETLHAGVTLNMTDNLHTGQGRLLTCLPLLTLPRSRNEHCDVWKAWLINVIGQFSTNGVNGVCV